MAPSSAEPRDGQVCSVCGRSVEGLDEARQAGKDWFCSPSHLLSFEGRVRARHTGNWSRQAAVIVLVAVGLLALSRLHRSNHSPAPILQALKELQAEAKTQPAETLFAGKLSRAAQAVADTYMIDEYVKRDCSQANAHFDTDAEPIAPCSGNLSLDATQGRDYLVRGTPRVERDCREANLGLGPLLEASQCYVFTLVGYTNKLSSITIGGEKRPTWSYTVTRDEVWLENRQHRWLVDYETSSDLSTVGTDGPEGRAAKKLWSERIPTS